MVITTTIYTDYYRIEKNVSKYRNSERNCNIEELVIAYCMYVARKMMKILNKVSNSNKIMVHVHV